MAEAQEAREHAKIELDGLKALDAVQYQRPKNDDPIIHGAIADAIGGPAIGAITYYETQQENPKRQQAWEDHAETRAYISGLYQSMQDTTQERVRELDSQIIGLKRSIETAESRIVDKDPQYFDYLEIELDYVGPLRNKDNGLAAYFSVKAPSSVQVLGNVYGVVDGSLCIKAIDKNGKVIASGFYNAPGANILPISKSKVVFANENYAVCALVPADSAYSVKKEDVDHYEITPWNIWAVATS